MLSADATPVLVYVSDKSQIMLAFMQVCQTVGAIVNFVEDAGRQPISGCTRPTCVGDIRAYMGPGRLAPPPPSGMRLSAEAHGLWPSLRRVVYLGGGRGPSLTRA